MLAARVVAGNDISGEESEDWELLQEIQLAQADGFQLA